MQNNRGNTIGQGKTLTWRTEKLKDDRSERIDVNLMHSDTPMFNFFKKLLWMRLKAEFMRKIELNTNRRDWKECENNKKNVHAKHKNVIKNIKGKKSLSGNAAVTILLFLGDVLLNHKHNKSVQRLSCITVEIRHAYSVQVIWHQQTCPAG